MSLQQIKRGCVELISEEELVAKLKKGRPLRVKAGFDPTAPDLHLGHTVLLQKLRQFQELGHQVIFLIGDFTATIGDPSGRNETRPPLTEDEIRQNIKTYQDQVFKILDKKKTEVAYNSTWMKKKSAADIIRLASHYTMARMLERNDFEKRHRDGHSIAIHEFLYPLIQGNDSVELKADIELGGNDQKFNLLVGRALQKDFGQEPQVVMTLPLLLGTDGVQKMSKSYGNYIGVTDAPSEMFGKVMSISDELMWNYYELLSAQSLSEIASLKSEVTAGRVHPKQAKIELAKEIVARFHGKTDAEQAAEEFDRVFAHKGKPDQIETLQWTSKHPTRLAEVLKESGLAPSNAEAKRKVMEGAVKVNDQKVIDPNQVLTIPGQYTLQLGKRQFVTVQYKK